jgi:hypothetical protein
MFHVWLNFLWFIVNFFSLQSLTRSWFAPWKRMTEARSSIWNFEEFAGYIIINLLSRLIGAMLRTIIIVLGLLSLLVVVVFGMITYVFWVFAPAMIIFLMGIGITVFVTNIIV